MLVNVQCDTPLINLLFINGIVVEISGVCLETPMSSIQLWGGDDESFVPNNPILKHADREKCCI